MSSLADLSTVLAARLTEERDRRRLSQKEAAAQLGCSVRSYQAYEAGQAFPRPEMRRRIDAWLEAAAA